MLCFASRCKDCVSPECTLNYPDADGLTCELNNRRKLIPHTTVSRLDQFAAINDVCQAISNIAGSIWNDLDGRVTER